MFGFQKLIPSNRRQSMMLLFQFDELYGLSLYDVLKITSF